MNFTQWYQVKENSNILILGTQIDDLEKYKNKSYDYIYLDGTLENVQNPVEILHFFKELLNEDGRIFVAVDNKYGVKYLVGNKSEHCERIYDSLKDAFNNGRIFSKSELDEIIRQAGFKYKRYYYPLPNYEMPNVIFSDKFLPDKSDSKINYNVIYDENSLIVQDEISLLKIFIEQNKFVEFTNSYIVELSNNEIQEDVKYYSFNNMRKDKYSLVLKMKDDYVEKYPRTKEAIQHIRNINKNSKNLKELGFLIAEEYEEKIVRGRFIDLDLLDKQIVRAIYNRNYTEAYEMIDNWYKLLQEKLQPNEEGIVRDGFIDLVFENTFFNKDKNEYIFFDQEWYERNVPIRFILYRAISNLYAHNPEIKEKISEEEMLQRYKINSEEFVEKEQQIQKEIVDEEKKMYYSKQYEYRISSEELKQIIKDLKRLDKDNVELLNEIKRLQEKDI